MTSTTLSQGKSERGEAVSTKEVVSWLRDRIRIGKFVQGQRLIEADITKATKASRSKVREALQRLETEGLVVIEEFRGASVRSFTSDEVKQIYRTRAVLEGLAAREFAAADAPEAKNKLRALQDELNKWDSTGDHEHFATLNNQWHALIIEESGNDYVRGFVARLTVPIYRILFSTFYNAQRIDAANADHREVTAAIVEGRAEEAEKAMRKHILHGLQALSVIDSHLGG